MSGYWGDRTATIDWCEANYEVTHYIAEFWNTISNLVMIVFPIYSMYWSYKHIQMADRAKKNAHNQLTTNAFVLPKSVLLSQFGLMLVGIGSWMFHMTLLYPMQLLDELPMIYGSAMLIYANYDLILSVFKLEQPKSLSKFASKPLVFTLLTLYCIFVTCVYLSVWKNPIFHEFAYGFLVILIIIESAVLINKLKASKHIYFLSLFYYFFGFFLWNMDNKFCSYLQYYRASIDQFFGLDNATTAGQSSGKLVLFNTIVVLLKSVFEFHSLWHLFTGYASYMTILFIINLNYQFHLKRTNQTKDHKLRPISSKYFKLYYHLNNDLLNRSKVY